MLSLITRVETQVSALLFGAREQGQEVRAEAPLVPSAFLL